MAREAAHRTKPPSTTSCHTRSQARGRRLSPGIICGPCCWRCCCCVGVCVRMAAASGARRSAAAVLHLRLFTPAHAHSRVDSDERRASACMVSVVCACGVSACVRVCARVCVLCVRVACEGLACGDFGLASVRSAARCLPPSCPLSKSSALTAHTPCFLRACVCSWRSCVRGAGVHFVVSVQASAAQQPRPSGADPQQRRHTSKHSHIQTLLNIDTDIMHVCTGHMRMASMTNVDPPTRLCRI